MNSDIRINVSWLSHPKRKKLERRLGAQGVLSFLDLLLVVAQNKPNGHLDGWSREDVSIAGQWPGDVDEFVDVLLDVQLLDSVDSGSLSVHDWKQHNPYACGAEERSERARHAANVRYGKPSPARSLPVACSPHASSTIEQCPSPSPSPYPKEKEKKVVTTVSENRNGSRPSSPIFLDDEYQWQNITDAHLTTWSQAYPACDITSELLKSALYIRAHPHKRKRNWERYILGWFGRSQEWGGTRGKTTEWDIDAWAKEKDGK